MKAEQVQKNHICNECGLAFTGLPDLQLHLKRKTAWSHASLVGCRISCLVDYKEWHEGFVTQFHRSGKHHVDFRQLGEKRWLNMKKIAFYIIERSIIVSDHDEVSNNGGEIKENEPFASSEVVSREEVS
jgi:hypothetical protein